MPGPCRRSQVWSKRPVTRLQPYPLEMTGDTSSGDRSERRASNRLALIGAGAALMGGIIGAAAGVGASVIQSNAQRDLAIRQERREAYQEVSLAMLRYLEASRKVHAVSTSDQPAFKASATQLCQLSEALFPSVANVQVVGSGEAFQRAADAVGHAREDCDTAAAAAASSGALPDSAVGVDVIGFLTVVRGELGSGSLGGS